MARHVESPHRLPLVPHKGSLRRVPATGSSSSSSAASGGNSLDPTPILYSIELANFKTSRENSGTPRLLFTKAQLDSMQRLFLVLDTDCRGWLDYSQVEEFFDLRCSVVQRRDASRADANDAFCQSTLDEAWDAIVQSGLTMEELEFLRSQQVSGSLETQTALGMEGWMILLRFVSFCQYHEAKHRFSAKHLGGNSNMVVVDVPPPSIIPLTMKVLIEYESKFQHKVQSKKKKGKNRTRQMLLQSHQYCPPMPELDLNHCCIAAHESMSIAYPDWRRVTDHVRADACTSSIAAAAINERSSLWNTSAASEVLLTLTVSKSPRNRSDDDDSNGLMSTVSTSTTVTTTVRRTLEDLRWLHDTLLAHKRLGGTLCGRILPPFPQEQKIICSKSKFDELHRNPSDAVSHNIVSICKSVWGTLKRNTTTKSTSSLANHSTSKGDSILSTRQEVRLKRLGRYLNYLLEHAGLRSSFPLNAVLKASKTGLEAAKRSLEDLKLPSKGSDVIANNSKISAFPSDAADQSGREELSDNALATRPSTAGSSSPSHKVYNSSHNGSYLGNLEWIRPAAQAAMALKLHGFLDATGMSTYSAKLQHASLPPLDYHQSFREDSSQQYEAKHATSNADGGANRAFSTDSTEDDWEYSSYSPEEDERGEFESEVKSVQCELDDEYDLLPEPSMMHSPLYEDDATLNSYAGLTKGLLKDDTSIDPDIDKLREVIGTVATTLHKCVAAHHRIATAREARVSLRLGVVRGLDTHTYDSYEVSGGMLTIDEQSFLRGITNMERCGELVQESDLGFGEALSWQSSLASSAVSAAEDVRDAARAARTAAGAKTAAEAAFLRAKKSLDKVSQSSSPITETDLHAAKTRAAISHSHAIHAALVAHETTAVKRKAAMAIAHDVQQWNAHRRREMLRACLSAARSQRDAIRKEAEAWRVLKEGMLGPMEGKGAMSFMGKSCSTVKGSFSSEEDYECGQKSVNAGSSVVSDSAWPAPPSTVKSTDEIGSMFDQSYPGPVDTAMDSDEGMIIPPSTDHAPVVPAEECPLPSDMETAPSAPIPPSLAESPDLLGMNTVPSSPQEAEPNEVASPSLDLDNYYGVTEESSVTGALPPTYDLKQNQVVPSSRSSHESGQRFDSAASIDDTAKQESKDDEKDAVPRNPEMMTESMQSLVDGLISWGGRFDPQEDVALPQGMAVSIALEDGSNMKGSQSSDLLLPPSFFLDE